MQTGAKLNVALEAGGACLVWIAEDCPAVMSTDVCTGQICLSRDSDDSGFVGAIGVAE